ncbi:MAG: radical SAM protein [Clostridia bacterium]|nr:radical SAM protein [Clostridia bacterium]
MLKKAFFEITNACNLACTFCHGTRRPIRYVTTEEFTAVVSKLKGHVEFLYFHLMGEPLLHPRLAEFLAIAGEMGMRVILTTNGTLLPKQRDILLSAPALHKVSVSLHSYEVNHLNISLEDYLDGCFAFCRDASARGIISVMRLWNAGGADSLNETILTRMHSTFPGDWREIFSGYKIADRLFLEWGEKFDWPDENAEYRGDTNACYGLRNQIGILSDGTVVPCCLDADGAIPLGNLYTQELSEILANPRAVRLKRSHENRKIDEPLCQRCGYAAIRNY